MHFFCKQWRALIGALALAVSVISPGVALAQQSGENNSFIPNHTPSLLLTSSFSEARTPDQTLLQVWRGADNDGVWGAINDGNPFPIGTGTHTDVPPTAVSMGNSGWMILHTGLNSNIYYTILNKDGSSADGQWHAIPGQTTNSSMSAAPMGLGSSNIYLVYRSSNDGRIWGTMFSPGPQAGTGTWTNGENIGLGSSPLGPTITYAQSPGGSAILIVAARGEDNQVWTLTGNGFSWNSWTRVEDLTNPTNPQNQQPWPPQLVNNGSVNGAIAYTNGLIPFFSACTLQCNAAMDNLASINFLTSSGLVHGDQNQNDQRLMNAARVFVGGNNTDVLLSAVFPGTLQPTYMSLTLDTNSQTLTPTTGWTLDTTGYQTINPVTPSVFPNNNNLTTLYGIITGLDGVAYYKQLRNQF